MKKLLSVLAITFIAVGCRAPSEETSDTSSIVYTGSRWSNPAAIPVCWENGSAVDAEILNDVKAKLIAEYHNKTKLRFTRFDNCSSADLKATMIRVHFNFAHNWDNRSSIGAGGGLSWIGPNSGSLGGTAANGTMRIDIGNKGKYPETGHPLRQFAIDQTRGTAVHEFGHAVGLAHEHERSDAPNCGDQQRTPNNSNFVYVGNYDPSSIMNYCKTNNIDSLSAGDVSGVNFLYPQASTPTPSPTPVPEPKVPDDKEPSPAPAGSFYLVARHSQACVDISSSSKSNGAKVQQWGCNKTSAQMFRLVASNNGSYLLQNTNSGKCLDVVNASKDNLANVHQWGCANLLNQRVFIKPTSNGYNRIQFVHSNLCMDVSNASKNYAAQILQYSCHADGPHQEFALVKAD